MKKAQARVSKQIGFLVFDYEAAKARLTLWDNGTGTVSGVYSRIRGKGYANVVMQGLVEHADKEDLELLLEVQRYGYSDTLSPGNEELIKFYGKFGFEVVPESGRPVLMKRKRLTEQIGEMLKEQYLPDSQESQAL